MLCEIRREYCISGVNTLWDQAWILQEIRRQFYLSSGVKILRDIWDQSRILYGIRSEYYVRSGVITVRYKAFILHVISRQYSMKLDENIMWGQSEFSVRYGVNTAWDRAWILCIRRVYYVRSGASILWDQARMLFYIKNLSLKGTGQ